MTVYFDNEFELGVMTLRAGQYGNKSGIAYGISTGGRSAESKLREARQVYSYGSNLQERDVEILRESLAQSRAIAKMIEDQCPDGVGWIRTQRSGAWTYVSKGHPKGNKAKPFPGACFMHVSGDLYSGICGRPVDPDHGLLCKMHAAHQRRRVAQHEKWQRERDERFAESERIAKIRNDLREEWEAACDAIGIERLGDPLTMQSTGRAILDSEALSAILRYVIESKG